MEKNHYYYNLICFLECSFCYMYTYIKSWFTLPCGSMTLSSQLARSYPTDPGVPLTGNFALGSSLLTLKKKKKKKLVSSFQTKVENIRSGSCMTMKTNLKTRFSAIFCEVTWKWNTEKRSPKFKKKKNIKVCMKKPHKTKQNQKE